MRVLLTGGYGCIGSWISRILLGRGDEVWIYDLKEDPRRYVVEGTELVLMEVPFIGAARELPATVVFTPRQP